MLKLSYKRQSLMIEFDIVGAKYLIESLISTTENKPTSIDAIYEEKRCELLIKQTEETNNTLVTEKKVEIEMDADEIQYFIERLLQSLESKIFYPSEICEKSFHGKSVSFYAKFV